MMQKEWYTFMPIILTIRSDRDYYRNGFMINYVRVHIVCILYERSFFYRFSRLTTTSQTFTCVVVSSRGESTQEGGFVKVLGP